MLKKLFIQTLFSFEIGWIEDYIKNVNSLEKDGWNWIVFTDMPIKSRGNFTVVPMDLDGFKRIVQEKTGVWPQMTNGNIKYGDFFCSFGYLFEDYLAGYDFWGFTNFDVVYGRLSHYLPDSFLNTIDVYGNDPDDTSGHFTLIRNNSSLNSLFKKNPNWKKVMEDRQWQGYDEGGFSKLVKIARKYKKLKAEFRFWQEHDKEEDHLPAPRLKMLEDGALVNSITNKEMMVFHFRRTKQWPIK